MSLIERTVMYFEAPGKQNTKSVLRAVREYAEKNCVDDIVVASTTGETGVETAKLFKDFNLVVVTHHSGFSKPSFQELKEENRQQISAQGAKILTASHALSGGERAIRKKFGTIEPLEIIAHALRLFGEGTKVCVEIVLMAADAGLIQTNKDVIAIAGSGRGADTALLMKPANSTRLFDAAIKEIIAKPRNF